MVGSLVCHHDAVCMQSMSQKNATMPGTTPAGSTMNISIHRQKTRTPVLMRSLCVSAGTSSGRQDSLPPCQIGGVERSALASFDPDGGLKAWFKADSRR